MDRSASQSSNATKHPTDSQWGGFPHAARVATRLLDGPGIGIHPPAEACSQCKSKTEFKQAPRAGDRVVDPGVWKGVGEEKYLCARPARPLGSTNRLPLPPLRGSLSGVTKRKSIDKAVVLDQA